LNTGPFFIFFRRKKIMIGRRENQRNDNPGGGDVGKKAKNEIEAS